MLTPEEEKIRNEKTNDFTKVAVEWMQENFGLSDIGDRNVTVATLGFTMDCIVKLYCNSVVFILSHTQLRNVQIREHIKNDMKFLNEVAVNFLKHLNEIENKVKNESTTTLQ